MLNRNQLTHAVIWPDQDAKITLIDTDGVIQGGWLLNEPIRGSEVAKVLPEGCHVEALGCAVLSMSGKVLYRTVAPFDTAVVIEKAELGFEERMQMLERRQKRSELREKKKDAEIKRLLEERDAREREDEVVEEEDEKPEKKPEEKTEAKADVKPEAKSDET